MRFESAAVDGHKLVKTYTLRRGNYTIDVKHEFINDGAGAGDAAAVPAAGARRQPARGRVVVLFHLHRPGGLHRRGQVPEDRLQGHREGQGRPRQERQQRLDRDGPALLRLGLVAAAATCRASSAPQKVADNLYAVAMVTSLGEVAPGQRTSQRGDAVRRPAGGEQARRAGAGPRAGEGLRLVHDPGQAAVLAADTAARACSATGAGRSSRWWCC